MDLFINVKKVFQKALYAVFDFKWHLRINEIDNFNEFSIIFKVLMNINEYAN